MFMVVPVVQVGPVRMRVGHGRVPVPVRVHDAAWQVRMPVVMVPVIVAMRVLVLHRLVRVRVGVALDHEKRDPGDE